LENPPEKAASAKPVYFNVMIPKWAKHYGKGKKCRQDMETKCGVFIEWQAPRAAGPRQHGEGNP
jgi:hypothetical protein